jgi:4-hydroxy-2-oxoheptanedioate aldolase
VIGSLTVVSEELRGRLAAAVKTPGDGHASGRPLVGTVISVPDVGLAELTAAAVDFVWIDLEHGALSGRDVQPLAIAARSAGAAALVRLRAFDDIALGPALDTGVDGVVAPRIERVDEVERLVRRLRYPPDGARGLASRRASGYQGAGAEPICFVQLESRVAVEQAEAIARVDGVDALVVGCSDLALDMGEELAQGSPRCRDAIARVTAACSEAGIAAGVAGPDDPDLLLELAGAGAGVLVLGADVRIFARALRGSFAGLRDRWAARHPSRTPPPEEAHVGA